MGLFALLLFINGCGYLFISNYKLVKMEDSNLCKMNILNGDIAGYEYNTLNNVLKIDTYKENNNYVVVFTTYKKSYDNSALLKESREYYNYESLIKGNKISQVINNNEYLGFYEEYYKRYNIQTNNYEYLTKYNIQTNNYDYVKIHYLIHYKINYKANSLYEGIEIVDNTNLQDYFINNKIITLYKQVQPFQYIGANNQLKTIESYELIILYLPSDEVEECINGEPYKLAK